MVTPLPKEVVSLNDGVGTVTDIINQTGTSVTFKDAEYKDDTFYAYNVQNGVDNVVVPGSIKKFQLNVNNDNEVTLTAPESEVTVNITNNANIKINPDQSSNLDVVGKGTIKLNPTTEVADLKDNTLKVGTIQPEGDGITLESSAPKLDIQKIDVYPIEGTPSTSITGNANGETTCQKLLLQGRSALTVKNIDLLNDIYIGLLSSIRLEDKTKFEKVNFHIKYNRQTPETIFPIVIKSTNDGFPNFEGHIKVERQEDVGAIISADLDELLIAQFDGNNIDDSYEACTNYSKQYDGGEGFGTTECYNSTKEGETKSYLKAVKSQDKGKDDKGLSAGAIAGIVIACVVVVAAIIALLVYFLVIKKRNQSTTSTQGDSSIAI